MQIIICDIFLIVFVVVCNGIILYGCFDVFLFVLFWCNSLCMCFVKAFAVVLLLAIGL